MLQENEGLFVPNLPCGVESNIITEAQNDSNSVPNLPCGVERDPNKSIKAEVVRKFLIYRVELKVI